jgi:8-oxo-dGTP pyrophosphatase MutT (NUDIX family)
MAFIREFLSTVFIVHKGRVLLNWNRKVRSWTPVGGHIDPNELPCAAAIREAKEETGLDIELVSPYDRSKTANLVQPVHLHLDHVRQNHKHINLIYFGKVKGGRFTAKNDEGTASKWFSRSDLENADLLPNVKEWAIEAVKELGKSR